MGRTTRILSPVDESWVHKRCRVRWWGLDAHVALNAGRTAPAAEYGYTMEPPYMRRGMSHTRNLPRQGRGGGRVGGRVAKAGRGNYVFTQGDGTHAVRTPHRGIAHGAHARQGSASDWARGQGRRHPRTPTNLLLHASTLTHLQPHHTHHTHASTRQHPHPHVHPNPPQVGDNAKVAAATAHGREQVWVGGPAGDNNLPVRHHHPG
jgi:hypothetical protein